MDGKKQATGRGTPPDDEAVEGQRSSRKSTRRRWSRARRPEEKQARRAAILAAATALLDEGGLAAASLSAIARAAKISKANLYRYFESREDILLTVMLEDTEDWLDALRARLGELADRGDHEAIVEAFVDSTCARPRLCMLMSSLSSVLEHNVSSARIVAFKRRYHVLMHALLDALAAAEPALGPEGARRFMSFFYSFVAGAWPITHPSDIVAEVLAREEFAALALDFEAALRDHARVTLRGLLA